MPKIVKTKKDEELWKRAREIIDLAIQRSKEIKGKLAKIEKESPQYFKLVVFIFKRLKQKKKK